VANVCVYAEEFVLQIDNDDSPFLLLSRWRAKREGKHGKGGMKYL